MENKRYAVIDLGTNTFHLLAIEEKEDGGIAQLYKERIYVKLAEEGIDTIGEEPFKRGMDALASFSLRLREFNISRLKAFGTAALRTASNGEQFVEKAREELGIKIELIPGQEEARLIHKGTMKAISIQEERILIMDIGGGSVEFVIADKSKVYWSESFPIGVAVLYREFHYNDPITPQELGRLDEHLGNLLKPFLKALEKYPVDILVGSSGTFDVLEGMIAFEEKLENSIRFKANKFSHFFDKLIFTSLEERFGIEEIPDTRADMIIVALELIRFVLEKTSAKDIIVSSFAMKEGILEELIKE